MTGYIEAWHTPSETCLGDRVRAASTSDERRTGLLRSDCFTPGQGLWLNPCEAVHTFGMRFPIDVIFLDRNGKVRAVKHSVRPWRIAVSLLAESALELPEGTSRRFGIKTGDQVTFRRSKEDLRS